MKDVLSKGVAGMGAEESKPDVVAVVEPPLELTEKDFYIDDFIINDAPKPPANESSN